MAGPEREEQPDPGPEDDEESRSADEGGTPSRPAQEVTRSRQVPPRVSAGRGDIKEPGLRGGRICDRFESYRYTPPVNLDVETSTKNGKTVVTLRGEIDVYTAPRLRQTLIDLVEGGATHIVVDMEKVDFLDSTGLGVLVGGLKRVRDKDGSMRLVATQDRILKIFDITGLSKVFPIHGSLDEALGS